jgi:phytoene/squalene synthetase
MDRLAQLTAEMQVLGTLCNREDQHEVRAELVHVLERYGFLEPEHQIVFESIRALLLRDRLSKARLAVHLNNRGFPDVDLEKYCAAAFANIEGALKLARRLCSLASETGASVGGDN